MNNVYKDRKYDVVEYDPDWAVQFRAEAERLNVIFGDSALDIQHIGSTSVPGMAGKPTLDVLVLVSDMAAAEEHKDLMIKAGYIDAGQFVMDNSRLFRRMKDNFLLANIHVFPASHPHVKEMICLRDYLRSHPEEVSAYSRIKKELFDKYPNDYAEYRKQKDLFMSDLKERAAGPN